MNICPESRQLIFISKSLTKKTNEYPIPRSLTIKLYSNILNLKNASKIHAYILYQMLEWRPNIVGIKTKTKGLTTSNVCTTITVGIKDLNLINYFLNIIPDIESQSLSSWQYSNILTRNYKYLYGYNRYNIKSLSNITLTNSFSASIIMKFKKERSFKKISTILTICNIKS